MAETSNYSNFFCPHKKEENAMSFVCEHCKGPFCWSCGSYCLDCGIIYCKCLVEKAIPCNSCEGKIVTGDRLDVV